MKKIYPLFAITALTTSLLLSACGNSTNSDANKDNTPNVIPQPQPFESSFTSTLMIEEIPPTGGSTLHQVKDRTTNEHNKHLAYSVSTQIANSLTSTLYYKSINYPQLNQYFDFTLDEKGFYLQVSYDPILKKTNSFTLTKIDSDTDASERLFSCNNWDDGNICKNAKLTYDAATGTVNIDFEEAEFTNFDYEQPKLILNGKLVGKLSIPPQNIQSIPKVSQGSIVIDGKTHQILAAVNTTEQIKGATISPANISMLLDNATNLSFLKSTMDGEVNSQYIDQKSALSNAYISTQKNLIYKELSDAVQFILSSSLFNFYSFGSDEVQKTINISGDIKAPLATQTLMLKPQPLNTQTEEQNNQWYKEPSFLNRTYTPSDIKVTVMNHNTVKLESNQIIARIEDRKVKSLQLQGLVHTSSSLLSSVVYLDYKCGDGAPECQNVTVEQNGFGVKFNNTILTNLDPEDDSAEDSLPPAITLNGGLVYVGR